MLGDAHRRYCRVHSSRTPQSRPSQDLRQPQTRPEQGLQERHCHRPQELNARQCTPATLVSPVGRRFAPRTPARGARGIAEAAPSFPGARPSTTASTVRDGSSITAGRPERGAAVPTPTPPQRPQVDQLRAPPAGGASSIVRESKPRTGRGNSSVDAKPRAAGKCANVGARGAQKVGWVELLCSPQATARPSSPRKGLGQTIVRDPEKHVGGGTETSAASQARRVGGWASMGELKSRKPQERAGQASESDNAHQTAPATEDPNRARRPQPDACDAATHSTNENMDQGTSVSVGSSSEERCDAPPRDPKRSHETGPASGSKISALFSSGPKTADAGVQASPCLAGEIAATETTRWLQWNPAGPKDSIWGELQPSPEELAGSVPPDRDERSSSSLLSRRNKATGGSARSSPCRNGTKDRESSRPSSAVTGRSTSAGDGDNAMTPRGQKHAATLTLIGQTPPLSDDVFSWPGPAREEPPDDAGGFSKSLREHATSSSIDMARDGSAQLPLDIWCLNEAAMSSCAPLVMSDPFARSATADLLPVAHVKRVRGA